MHSCNTTPLEMEAGAPGVQSQPQLSRMPESSLGYMRPISTSTHIYMYDIKSLSDVWFAVSNTL